MEDKNSKISTLREKFGQTPFSRAHDRLKFEVPVTVEVLIPEDTFSPHGNSGYTLNISPQGMQVALEGVAAKLYSRMLVRQRMARVSLTHPRTGKKLAVTGKIAWIDFRKSSGKDSAGDCSLGIAFSEKDDGVDLTAYSELVEDARQMLRQAEPQVRVLEL